MSKINSLNDIKEIIVHWCESYVISNKIGCDDYGDIDKVVSVEKLDRMISKECKSIKSGYTKISMTIKLEGGLIWCSESKFHITRGTIDLLTLINVGQ